jgi:hypothetical protein
VLGWAGEVRDVWWREYRRWDGYQAQQAGPQVGYNHGRTGWR